MQLSGDLQGVALISFTRDVLVPLSASLLGEEAKDDATLKDVANEILNIIDRTGKKFDCHKIMVI